MDRNEWESPYANKKDVPKDYRGRLAYALHLASVNPVAGRIFVGMLTEPENRRKPLGEMLHLFANELFDVSREEIAFNQKQESE